MQCTMHMKNDNFLLNKVLREGRNPVKCGNRRGGPGIKWGEGGGEMQFAFSHKKSYLMVSLALYPSVFPAGGD